MGRLTFDLNIAILKDRSESMGIDIKYLEIFYFITPNYNTILNICSIIVDIKE